MIFVPQGDHETAIGVPADLEWTEVRQRTRPDSTEEIERCIPSSKTTMNFLHGEIETETISVVAGRVARDESAVRSIKFNTAPVPVIKLLSFHSTGPPLYWLANKSENLYSCAIFC